ncbi:MAG: T9SS type A sorting domain-containing protein [Chitinophagales bacterium]|nr:T9SS type A sorting domain-containing protein [Chitinophagales bacterium]
MSHWLPTPLFEGVRWTGGLIYEPYNNLLGWEVKYNLKCLKVNNILQYLDTSYEYPVCDLPLGLTETELSREQLLVYPNPCSIGDNLFFEIADESKITIVIEDISGKIIFSEELDVNHSIKISSIFFSKGLFFYQMLKSNKPVHFGKLIIQ